MKLLSLVIVLISNIAMASPCSDLIFSSEKFFGKDYDGNLLGTDVLACILADGDFAKAKKGLCSADEKELSMEYKTYLEYRQKHEALMVEYIRTKDPLTLNLALIAKRDWMLFGYLTEVDGMRYHLSQAEYNCKARQ